MYVSFNGVEITWLVWVLLGLWTINGVLSIYGKSLKLRLKRRELERKP